MNVIASLIAIAAAIPGAASTGDNPVRGLGDRQLAGQRIVAGFPGETPPGPLVRMIREGRVAGVILFSHNFGSEAEARALTAKLRAIRGPKGLRQPLLIAVDQEGGLVKRLPGPPSQSARGEGAAGPNEAQRQGRRTGRYLEGLGFNLNFAPVLDLAIPGGEIALTSRGFAASPTGVARSALPFAKGMERQGVAASAKHFPGFGRATANTDDEPQTISTSRETLRERDERPFQEFARAGGDMVMLSNAVYPDLGSRRPAGLSRAVASRELRRRVGFDGVSVTDSLDAAAIQALGSPRKIAVMGASAGTDLLLFTSLSSARSAADALATDLGRGEFDRQRFRASVSRVLELRASLRR